MHKNFMHAKITWFTTARSEYTFADFSHSVENMINWNGSQPSGWLSPNCVKILRTVVNMFADMVQDLILLLCILYININISLTRKTVLSTIFGCFNLPTFQAYTRLGCSPSTFNNRFVTKTVADWSTAASHLHVSRHHSTQTTVYIQIQMATCKLYGRHVCCLLDKYLDGRPCWQVNHLSM